MTSDLIAVARITKTRGLRGEVVADILTDFPERFDNLERVFAVSKTGEISEMTLENHWFQKDRVILKFKDVNSIEAGELLKNLTISVPESEVVELEADSYFDWDLEGLRVETVEGENLGVVKEIYRAGENKNLVVKGAEKEYLIPFVKAICIEVDIENKRILVDPPDGLLDF